MRKLYLNILRILWIWVVAMVTPAFAQDLIQDEDRIDQLKSKIEEMQIHEKEHSEYFWISMICYSLFLSWHQNCTNRR